VAVVPCHGHPPSRDPHHPRRPHHLRTLSLARRGAGIKD
jgi:hypothetical protein